MSRRLVLRLSLVLPLLYGCGGSETPTDIQEDHFEATTIVLSASTVTLTSIGDTQQLGATVRDQNNQVMSVAEVEWSSADATIVSVSADGLLTAEDFGATTIIARSGAAAASIPASVEAQRGPWTSVSVGQAAACGIVESGDLYCWGAGNRGQLGTGFSGGTSVVDPDAYKETTPTLVLGGHRWRQVSVGNELTCGVEISGNAYCWGTGRFGSIGDGEIGDDRTAPTLVSGGHVWLRVRAGMVAACGVTESHDGYCWGQDNGGVGMLTGSSGDSHRPTPALVDGGYKWQDIIPAHSETCGLTTGDDIYCWGSDFRGQLGDGDADSTNRGLVLVVGGHEWSRLTQAGSTACGLTSSGEGFCWGADSAGALGDGAPADEHSNVPRPVAGGHTFAVMTGKCGVTADGAAYCWGNGRRGQLGNGNSGVEPSYFEAAPVLVLGDHQWADIDTYLNNTCAITVDGHAYCWGYGASGALGNGTTPDNQALPVQVTSPVEPS